MGNISLAFLAGVGILKKCAAKYNMKKGKLGESEGNAIMQAADEVQYAALIIDVLRVVKLVACSRQDRFGALVSPAGFDTVASCRGSGFRKEPVSCYGHVPVQVDPRTTPFPCMSCVTVDMAYTLLLKPAEQRSFETHVLRFLCEPMYRTGPELHV